MGPEINLQSCLQWLMSGIEILPQLGQRHPELSWSELDKLGDFSAAISHLFQRRGLKVVQSGFKFRARTCKGKCKASTVAKIRWCLVLQAIPIRRGDISCPPATLPNQQSN